MGKVAQVITNMTGVSRLKAESVENALRDAGLLAEEEKKVVPLKKKREPKTISVEVSEVVKSNAD